MMAGETRRTSSRRIRFAGRAVGLAILVVAAHLLLGGAPPAAADEGPPDCVASSETDILRCVNTAVAGQTIRIANGVYGDWGSFPTTDPYTCDWTAFNPLRNQIAAWDGDGDPALPAYYGALRLSASGEAGAPIVIEGESREGTILQGDVFLTILGSHVLLRNLTFEGAPDRDPASVCVNFTVTVSWSGNTETVEDVEIDGVTFRDRGSFWYYTPWNGNVRIDHAARDVRIHDSAFVDFDNSAVYVYVAARTATGSNGKRTDWPRDIDVIGNTFADGRTEIAVALGTGGWDTGLEDVQATIEDNLFARHYEIADEKPADWRGQPAAGVPPDQWVSGNTEAALAARAGHWNGNGLEMLEIKSSSNTIARNLFIGCNGYVSNRNGQNNVYDGNTFADQKPSAISIFDRDNRVVNNIFLGVEDGINLSYALYDTSRPGEFVRKPVVDTLIAHNTFMATMPGGHYTMGKAIQTSNRSGPDVGPAPDRTTIANNVFMGLPHQMLAEEPVEEEELGTNAVVVRNLFDETDVTGPTTGVRISGQTGHAPIFDDSGQAWNQGGVVFAPTSPVVDRGVVLADVTGDIHGAPRASGCKPDLGHLEQDLGPCNDPQVPVTFRVDGVDVIGPHTVTSGSPVMLEALVNDPDGLVYPVFYWLGVPNGFSHVWSFGDLGSPVLPLAAFTPSPLVTFTLDGATSPQATSVEVQVYDTKGTANIATLDIVVEAP